MGFVDVTTRRHKHRLITIFITIKSHSITFVGVIIGQADNVTLNVMQSCTGASEQGIYYFGCERHCPLYQAALVLHACTGSNVIPPLKSNCTFIVIDP